MIPCHAAYKLQILRTRVPLFKSDTWAGQILDIVQCVLNGGGMHTGCRYMSGVSGHKHCFRLQCSWLGDTSPFIWQICTPCRVTDDCLKHIWICYVLWRLILEQFRYSLFYSQFVYPTQAVHCGEWFLVQSQILLSSSSHIVSVPVCLLIDIAYCLYTKSCTQNSHIKRCSFPLKKLSLFGEKGNEGGLGTKRRTEFALGTSMQM